MKILALEFSSGQRSVAVQSAEGAPLVELIDASTTRDVKPFALIQAALEQAGIRREQIEGIAVGLGPGSYTGIRVAISIAQGWQLASEVKLVGIGTVETIATQVAATGRGPNFSVVIDAQRGEFYLADYESVAGQPRLVTALRIASKSEVIERERAGCLLVGPEVTKWFASGHVIFPGAASMLHIARGKNDFLPGEQLEPIYLRATTFVKAPPPRVLPGVLNPGPPAS